MTDFETVLLERDGGVATITANRPDQLNALNPQLLRDLKSAADELAGADDLDVVIVTGAGRAFIAGADIKAMVDYSSEEAEEFSSLGHAAFNAISQIPVPVIAAVNGFALGGGLEVALSCDLIYCGEKAKLGLPEVSLSVIPGWGGTQRLGRLIGWHAARELVYTGKQIRADEAKRIGLALDVFPQDEFLSKVREIAEQIASNGPLALRAAKRAMMCGADTDLMKGMEIEQHEFAGLFGTDDQREGMTAFIERREADFTRK